MKQPTFIFSIDAKALYEILQTAEIGKLIPYAKLTAAIGRNVQNAGRGVLETARKRAQRELGFVFGVIPTEGLQRMSDIEIVQSGSRTIDTIRRASRRGAKRQTAIRNFDALPNDIKIQSNTFASMFGALGALSTQANVKRLEERVTKAQAALPLAKTLEAFS